MTADEIKRRLSRFEGYYGIGVDELTLPDYKHRVDYAIINIQKRWIRGFEVKVSRADFLRDKKWTNYSQYLSSLSIACPEGLIDKEEVQSPFGLVWLGTNKYNLPTVKWIRRPKNMQKRNSLAWLFTYVEVIEREFARSWDKKK